MPAVTTRTKRFWDLNHLLGADTLDQGALQKAADQLANAECAVQGEQIRLRIDIASVLDREQRLALRELVRERIGAGRQQRRGGRTE